MPEGLWRVSLYFVDWDWHAAPYPRSHRLAFLDAGGQETCTARVADFGDGVYKVFGVRGGRDVTLRVRKDFSATVVLSGIFLDQVEPYTLPAGAGGPLQPTTGRLGARLTEMAGLAKTDPGAFLRALPTYAEMAIWALEDGHSGADGGLFGRRVQYELLGRTGVNLKEEATAFVGYAAAFQRAGDAAPEATGVLEGLGDEALAAGDLRHAELAYDQVLAVQAKRLAGTALADEYKARAVQFRALHSRYAMEKLRECLRVAEAQGAEGQPGYVRELAAELFALAGQDYKQSRGLVRLPYALPTAAYRRLVELVGYAKLPRAQREELMTCLLRQTWYTLGWEELAAEQERLIADIPDAELTGELITLLVRSYAVLVQSGPSYADRAAKWCERLRQPRPDGDWTVDSYFRMVQIYCTAGKWKEARDCCDEVIELRPESPEAKETKRRLPEIEAHLPKG